MCGIFGVLSSNRVSPEKAKKYTNFLADATVTSAVRGTDSTGVFAIKRDGAAEILKRPIAPWDFLAQTKTKALYTDAMDYSIVMGHVRSATRGNTSVNNAHPFHHGNVILMHNGTLVNVGSMGMTWTYDTDSEHIAKAMSEKENPTEVLEKINGAFALAWYDKRTDSMYLARNNQRELHYAECVEDNTIIIASEWKMLDWLAARHGIKIKEVWQVEAGTMVQIPRKDTTKTVITTFEEYKEPPLVHNHAWRGGYGSNAGAASGYRLPEKKGLTDYSLNPDDWKGVGITKDEVIHFQPLAVFLPKARSKAGILEGYMHETPWFMVRAAGIDIRKIFNPQQHPLKGKVLGIVNRTSNNPILVLKDVEVDTEAKTKTPISPKTYIRSVSIIDATFYPNGKDGNVVLLDKFNKSGKDFTVDIGAEPTTVIKNINGPDGRLISLDEYNGLTKHGCGFCNGDLPIAMANRILWIQDAPVCPTCAVESNGNRLNS